MAKKEPRITDKQRKAFKLKIQNPDKSMKWVMTQAGYTDKVANEPATLTRSEAWVFMVKKYLPDDDILRIHQRLLQKEEMAVINGAFVSSGQPHSDVKTALDLAYKVKGGFAAEQKEITHRLELTDDQYLRILKHRQVSKPQIIEHEPDGGSAGVESEQPDGFLHNDGQ